MLVNVTLHFGNYIGNPYWPEMEKVINIRKQSGVDRARSESKRTAALNAWLGAHNMTMDDYKALEAKAARPFYTVGEAPGAEIIVPAHHLHGFIGNAAANAPAALRLAKPEQIRTVMEWGDLKTGKSKCDGVFERFVRNPLTNQRRLQSNEYIADFDAVGTLRLVAEDAEKKAKQFIEWGGAEIGVGAARKMGYGRFTVTAWTPQA